ncbi:MAG: hypothetical protein EA379_02540 [Phycisphaerales bacterium]|nr:MAG: hypothetical protein EA379_02540 [Phycisphaerales bacterium]
MSLDISNVLKDWPYEPGQLNVRLIVGEDDEPKIQMRIDLGVLQMETEGRPDGLRPEGHESLLELQEANLDGHIEEHGSEEGFSLDAEDCRLLREEAVQYYHRYISLLVLEDYEGVIRDTSRNLRLLDFCAKHAEREEDRNILEQFRPYLIMMRARAMASQALDANEAKAAMLAIDDGLEQIRAHFTEIGRAEGVDASNEARLLNAMREALAPKLPVSQKDELRQRLDQAISQENYELAAILRDELKLMRE